MDALITPDVQLEGAAGLYLFRLLTAPAKRWATRNVDGYTKGDESFPCDDTRLARDIAEGMQAAGLLLI